MATRTFDKNVKTCSCSLCEQDKIVTKPHLAMTPQQMKELTDKGIAVSLPNASFLDGEGSRGWDIEPMFKRDTDMNTAWELEQVSKSKIIKAHKLDKKKFGE